MIFFLFIQLSDLDVKKNPENNMALILDINHKVKHTDVDMRIRYGKNPKDATKTLYLKSAMDRKIVSFEETKLDYQIEAGAPEYVSAGEN